MILSRCLVVLCLASATYAQTEVKSLLGRNLTGLPDTDGKVQAAKQRLEKEPNSAELAVALSKAYAAKRQYQEAVNTCAKAILVSPNSADLYLEKGHRELGLRKFAAAQADLSKAIELNPKQLDSHYHLGLAYYFQRHFDEAAGAFGHALDLAKTSDSIIDCSNWDYVSLRRAGKTDAAAQVLAKITPDVTNTEPHLFFYLQLLHFYQSKLTEEQVTPANPKGPEDIEGELSFDTINYGLGNWYLYNHDSKRAKEHFRKVVAGFAWNAWGFIGSEIELSRDE